MRFRYTWSEREWREAVTLASQRKQRGTSLNGMTYAILLIPMIGAVGDVVSIVRESGQFTRQSAIVPLLLVAFTAVTAILMFLTRWNTNRKRLLQASMPSEEREAIFQETGWLVGDGAEKTLRPWTDLQESRRGNRVVVLLRGDGFDAIPVRELSPEQAGHLQRLITRKLRPAV